MARTDIIIPLRAPQEKAGDEIRVLYVVREGDEVSDYLQQCRNHPSQVMLSLDELLVETASILDVNFGVAEAPTRFKDINDEAIFLQDGMPLSYMYLLTLLLVGLATLSGGLFVLNKKRV